MNNIDNLMARYPALSHLRSEIEKAADMIICTHTGGGKILLCGNGGSAADCEHISGELLKGFMQKRTPSDDELCSLSMALGSRELAAKLQRGIAAIPLTSLSASLSAFANDVDAELVFAQLTLALGRQGDLLICLSTSGNAQNAVRAASVARALGIRTIALVGEGGGELADICELVIKAPERETYKVQEYHLPIYHAICQEVEARLFC